MKEPPTGLAITKSLGGVAARPAAVPVAVARLQVIRNQ